MYLWYRANLYTFLNYTHRRLLSQQSNVYKTPVYHQCSPSPRLCRNLEIGVELQWLLPDLIQVSMVKLSECFKDIYFQISHSGFLFSYWGALA